MNDNFNLKEYLGSQQLLKEDNSGVKINTSSKTRPTGAVDPNAKGRFIPPKPKFYLLNKSQLDILKNWTASVKNSGGRSESPGAQIINGSLYVLVSMIPELEGKRGRGGKYGVRDDIKATFMNDQSTAMGTLKAIDYAIKNSPDKSVELPGYYLDKNTKEKAKLNYKRIDGKGSDNGYALYAAPDKNDLKETNNLNENKMNDNFDLKGYLGSKRLLKENFEMDDEEIDDSVYYKGDEEDIELDDMSDLSDFEPTEDLGWEDDLNEVEDEDVNVDDKEWYGDDEETFEIDDMANLDDFEPTEDLGWEDDMDENQFQPSPSTSPTTTPTVKPGKKTRRRTLTPPDDAPSTGPKASLEEVEDENKLANKIGERFNQLKQDTELNERMQTLAGLK